MVSLKQSYSLYKGGHKKSITICLSTCVSVITMYIYKDIDTYILYIYMRVGISKTISEDSNMKCANVSIPDEMYKTMFIYKASTESLLL